MPDSAERRIPPAWVEHAIWWQVYPLGFVGADIGAGGTTGPVEHTLETIIAWLDDSVALGCNGLALGPIFASQSHGYDTADFDTIDRRLGDDDDVTRLLAECASRGIRVIFDGVFNHVGRSHAWWRAAEAAEPGSPAAELFRWRVAPDGSREVATFEGHGSLVELNHENPVVIERVGQIMRRWLERGVSGWRLDAAYAVAPEFWRAVIAPLRADYPDAWFLGEVIHGDYAEFVADSGVDSVTQYQLWKAIWSSLNDGNLFELQWALSVHNGLLDSFLPLTFVGNHDVTRIASQLTDRRHLGHAIAILMCVGGTPSVYYGDERGFEAVKEERFGGDDAIRPAFPADPSGLERNDVFRLHQELIGFRRRHAWLATARTSVEDITNTAALLVSTSPDGARVSLALNLGDESVVLGGTAIDPHSWRLGD